jgi:hypothetical protein
MSTGVPVKGALLKRGEKHKVTIHGAPRGQKANIQWSAPLFSKRIAKDTAMVSLPQCPAPRLG